MGNKVEGACTIDIDIYGTKVGFVFGQKENAVYLNADKDEIELVYDCLEEVDFKYESSHNSGATLELGPPIVYMPHFDLFNSGSVGVLAHEITHVTYLILRDVGMELTDSSQEAYAYLNGYITEKVYDYIFSIS